MKNIVFIYILLFSTISFSLNAQKKNEGYWGKPYFNIVYSAAATRDGGYILTGLTRNGINDAYGDILVIKLDANADTQWTFTYGGPFLEGGNCVLQTIDGGYMVAGHTQDFGAVDCDGFLMKLDQFGNRQWFKIYGGYADDIAEGTIQLTDGGYIFAGITESYGNLDTSIRNRHIYFVKTNEIGDTLWTKVYAGIGSEYGLSITAKPTGGYLAVGWSNSWGLGEKDGFVFNIDNNGNLLWKQLYKSDTGDTKFFKILPTIDNGYIIAGSTNEPFGSQTSQIYKNSQGIAVKLDANGNEVWRKTFGSANNGVSFHDVAQLPNGNFMFTGYSFSLDSTGNIYVLTTDINGNIIIDEYCGGNYSYADAIALQGNNGYLVAGTTTKFGNPFGDAYWMGTDNTNAHITTVSNTQPSFFPNPVSNVSEIILPYPHANQTINLSIYDISGILTLSSKNIQAKNIIVSNKDFVKGFYFYKIICEDGTLYNGKFIVE